MFYEEGPLHMQVVKPVMLESVLELFEETFNSRELLKILQSEKPERIYDMFKSADIGFALYIEDGGRRYWRENGQFIELVKNDDGTFLFDTNLDLKSYGLFGFKSLEEAKNEPDFLEKAETLISLMVESSEENVSISYYG